MSERSSSSGGIGVCGLLGVVFVVLKLTGVIHWSWWWVTAPFWGGAAILAIVVLGALVIAGVVTLVGTVLERRSYARRARQLARLHKEKP